MKRNQDPIEPVVEEKEKEVPILEHNQPNQIREIDIYVVKLGKNN
jgi:hypothetical protein